MPNKSKAENAIALAKAGIPRKSWSKPEFCARNGISPGFYDKLKKLGLGPEETNYLDRILITVEAEDRWLALGAAARAKVDAA
jgi:hypothetical protein